MDFLIRNEINKLKGEIESSNYAIEAEKHNFERMLKNGLAEEMKNYLNNPPKSNLITKLKIKYARWKLKRKELKRIKNEGLI